MALEITDTSFGEVIKTDKLVIIDFWAAWCGPCKTMSPIIDELAQDYEGKAVVGKIDVDNNPGVTAQFGIRNIPTILFFKNGEMVDRQVGLVPKPILVEKIDSLL